jgi:hypothetical protein
LHREKKDFKVATFAVLVDARMGDGANPKTTEKKLGLLFYSYSMVWGRSKANT